MGATALCGHTNFVLGLKLGCDNDLTDKSEDDEILTSSEQAGDKFACEICYFVSNWANGLRVHMIRKHQQIEQLDGTFM